MTCEVTAVGAGGVLRWRVLVLVTVRRVALEHFLFGCFFRGADDFILVTESLVG